MKSRIQEKVKNHFYEIRKTKELQHLLETNLSNWKAEIQEEHPYVEVMPTGNEAITIKGKKKIEEINPTSNDNTNS